jgi:glutathione peroxidase
VIGDPAGLVLLTALHALSRPAFASQPHYTALNKLQATYGGKGLLIVGFPCNQFGGQEPGANDEILNGLKYVRPGNGFVPAFPLTTKVRGREGEARAGTVPLRGALRLVG